MELEKVVKNCRQQLLFLVYRIRGKVLKLICYGKFKINTKVERMVL